MRSLTATIETDVCVVGAGLTGLAHALAARRRGLGVVVLERAERARGTSVRSGGQLPFSCLASAELGDIGAARSRWLELARRGAVTISTAGTLVPARDGCELDLLAAIAAEPLRGARMLTRAEVGAHGGMLAAADLRIDPRAAPAALARLLAGDPRARIEWSTPARVVEPGSVECDGLRVRADAIVVCPGLELGSLPAPLAQLLSPPGLRRVQLLRAAGSAAGRRRPGLATQTGALATPTLASSAALLAHPGIAELPAAAVLARRLELERPELVERRVELSVAPLPNGDLVIGEAGAESPAREPFSSERLDALLLAEAGRLLGYTPRVLERWSDLRSSEPAGAHRGVALAPCPGVRVVLDAGPVGRAMCHVRAARLLDDLLSGAPAVTAPAQSSIGVARRTGGPGEGGGSESSVSGPSWRASQTTSRQAPAFQPMRR